MRPDFQKDIVGMNKPSNQFSVFSEIPFLKVVKEVSLLQIEVKEVTFGKVGIILRSFLMKVRLGHLGRVR